MKRWRNGRLLLILIIIAMGIAACTLQPPSNTTMTAAESRPAIVRIRLDHSPTGSSELRWDPRNTVLTVILSVVGLAPKSTHLVHIHTGKCATMGQIVYTLNPIVADAHGVGTSATTMYGIRSGIPSRGWGITIHNGPTFATGLDARPIACGNIRMQTMKSGVQRAHANLTATISPDENVHGMAQVRRMDTTSIVTLSLSGMAPNTTHLAHIHAGSCAAQGPVLFSLEPLVADAQGRAMTVTTITVPVLPPAHWYINVHEAGTMAAMMTPQGLNPIACGNGEALF